MEVFLQPSGDSAKEQLEITIYAKRNLDTLRGYITEEQYSDLEKIYPSKEMNMWGVTYKKQNVWEQMQEGDLVLFYGMKKFFKKGIIKYKIHNKELAENIWGFDDNGLTWECIYFMDNASDISISLDKFNDITGYNFKMVQGAMSIKKEGAKDRLLREYQDILIGDYEEIQIKEKRSRARKLEEEIWNLKVDVKKGYKLISLRTPKKGNVNSGKRSKKERTKENSTEITEGLSKAAKSHLGILGEKFVYDLLKSGDDKGLLKRLNLENKELEIEWYNKGYDNQRDWEDRSKNKGHDILVRVKGTNEEEFLEVKTSIENTEYYSMTGNELRFSKSKGDNYYIVKIINFKFSNEENNGKEPQICVIRDPYNLVQETSLIKDITMDCWFRD